MTNPPRHIMMMLVCVGLALLALPGAAAPLDQSFLLSLDEPAPFPGADDTPAPGAAPDLDAAALNRSFIFFPDGPGTFPGANGTLTAGAAPGLEAAPLNPAFVRYQEELDVADGPMLLCAVAPEDEIFPPLTGLVPSPATLIWSDDATGVTSGSPTESYFNLADEGRVTPVKDQGDCGSCWAFASLASLESALLSDGLGEWNLSENNLKNTHGFDWGPCDGGNSFMTTAYLARWSGPVNESDDPYSEVSGVSPPNLAPVMQVQNVTYLPPRAGPLDNDLIKTTIRDEGGLYVGFLLNYSCFGPEAATYYLPENSTAKIDGGHAVLLVGWNDTYPATNFVERPPGPGAFIAKNSWGTSVGDNGYFSISYYDRSFGRFSNSTVKYIGDDEATVLFTGEPNGTYDHLYQYDPLGWTESIGTSTTMYGANIFTAERYEDLHAVSFYTREPGTGYEVTVSSEDGSLTYRKSSIHGTIALPGYHSVPLETAVPLVPGQKFSVTLKVTAPTDPHPLVVEMPIEDYSSNATAHPGESFVSTDGKRWADLTAAFPDTNLCIKAFTREPLRVPEDHLTIQAAVDAALPGEMILVGDGTYQENIVVDRPLTLLATGDAVIDGHYGDVLTLTGSNITVRGITLTDGADGVLVAGNDTRLLDMYVTNCSGNGISVDGASTTIIAGVDVITAGKNGIWVKDADLVGVFQGNLSESDGNGIAVSESDMVYVLLVNASDNDENGIAVFDSDTVYVFSVHTSDNDENGILFESTDTFLLQGCTAAGNAGTGLCLETVRYGMVSQNTMAGNTWNLYFSPYKGYEETVMIDETNTVDGKPVYVWSGRHDEAVPTDAGTVYLMGCRNITAADLTLSSNVMGLYVYNSTDITVRNILATGNGAGVYCQDVGNLLVDASALVTNGYSGIFCRNCTATAVTSSRIADNSIGAVIFTEDPDDTVLWHNTFANNTREHLVSYGDVALNTAAPVMYRYNGTYYTHAIGNYWDDYAGNDTDGDGVGETPYTTWNMYTRVNDTCPLVAPADRYTLGAPNNDGDDDWGGIGAGGNLNAGATTSMKFEGSAVTEITLTAAERIDGVMVTVAQVTDGPDGLDDAVYQYFAANLTYVTDDAIAGAVFTFDVPAAWLNAQRLAPNEVALWRYHNGIWAALPTETVREEGGHIVYRATSAGFSYFAVAAGRATEPSAPAHDDPGTTAVNATAETPVTSETPLPAAPTTTATTPPAPTAPAQSPLPWWLAAFAAGGTVSLIRRR